jgi:hypothetical protein
MFHLTSLSNLLVPSAILIGTFTLWLCTCQLCLTILSPRRSKSHRRFSSHLLELRQRVSDDTSRTRILYMHQYTILLLPIPSRIPHWILAARSPGSCRNDWHSLVLGERKVAKLNISHKSYSFQMNGSQSPFLVL